ncbi:MAG: hydrogenase maturation protease [Anaerolineae bacterium]|nr:hydrogenase maturation protease [Anaerolineae bacterium]
MKNTIILCLGNLLRGDDGVGIAVHNRLAAEASLPEDVDLVDGGTPGLETVLLLQGYQRAIIIDAADMGRRPGEWVRFSHREASLQSADMALRGTLHSAGLAEALVLGDALDVLPSEIVIYGIQPQEIGWAEGLSELVQAAVPAICAAVLDEVASAAC